MIIAPPPSKGMCDVSHDIFKFGEISDSISITVQELHSCNGTLLRNHMWPIE